MASSAVNTAVTSPPPVTVDDSTTADAALALLDDGATLLWRGDFHNGRQLLKAVDRRLTRRAARRASRSRSSDSVTQVFLRQRAERADRADILGRIVVDVVARDSAGSGGPDWVLELRRAPDVASACAHAWGRAGKAGDRRVVPFTGLQGILGAWQWHERGVEVPVLGQRIYPDYGVFSPTRSEYVDLVDRVAAEELVPGCTVTEVGTGTGVLAIVLARKGAGHVTATDVNSRAVVCARRNVELAGQADRIDVVEADLWPVQESAGTLARADIVVFNPPWLPGTPTSDLELGIYDAGSDILRRFLAQLADRLVDGGEGWLVLSDLAEHLGLRTRQELEQWISDGGLQVLGRVDTEPRHPKVLREDDPLHAARSREITSLWRLGRAASSPTGRRG